MPCLPSELNITRYRVAGFGDSRIEEEAAARLLWPCVESGTWCATPLATLITTLAFEITLPVRQEHARRSRSRIRKLLDWLFGPRSEEQPPDSWIITRSLEATALEEGVRMLVEKGFVRIERTEEWEYAVPTMELILYLMVHRDMGD